ncbi:MAG: basic amino acid ABC transporter substrate-binding protein [Eubacteriales bacterium]|nr:basic amino acid ABC transporter substrate-binding protein [Eubacteriales bacterium]MDD4768517.1 basic amino acid ABC transporter substrate-binding protein [Eubacteriales bacterium]
MKKSLAALIVLLLCVAALNGCTGKNDVLRVGTEATFPPFESQDENGEFIGFDMDIIAYIAADNGWEYEIVNIAFDTLVDSLEGGGLDIVIAAMTIDDDRSQRIDFSNPYYDASQIIVVREDDTREFSMDDIAALGLKIAVQMGTTGASEAQKLLGTEEIHNLYEYKRANEVFLELTSGRVDLVIIDQPVAKKYIQQMGGMKIYGEPFTEEKFGIAVQKGKTEMLKKINASLKKLVSSGEYQVLYDKWFEADE